MENSYLGATFNLLGGLFVLFVIVIRIFAVLTLAQLGVAFQPLLKANAVILLASITLAIAPLTNLKTLQQLLKLFETPRLSLWRVQVLAVTTRTDGRVALLATLQANAVLLRTFPVFARTTLLVGSDRHSRLRWVSLLAPKNGFLLSLSLWFFCCSFYFLMLAVSLTIMLFLLSLIFSFCAWHFLLMQRDLHSLLRAV